MEWLPIETAPKDYTEVIGMNAKGTVARTWFFEPSNLTHEWLRVGLPGNKIWNPVYWMPLPEPPVNTHDQAQAPIPQA